MQYGQSKKLVSKWMLIFYFACALTVSFLIYKFIDKSPERQQATDFLLSSQAIQQEFGVLESVSFDRGSAARISFRGAGREGTFPFTVTGSKKSGIVWVQWRSQGSGRNFAVLRLELLDPDKGPVVIWAAKQEN